MDGGGGATGAAVAGFAASCREAENRAAAVVSVTQVDLSKEGLELGDEDEDDALMARDGVGFCTIKYELGLG